MKALVLGATGATGNEILQLLLKNDKYQEVSVFVRRPLSLTHPKLQVHVIDFDALETWQHLVTGSVLFSCLGTTLKAAGSKKGQWKIDYEYQFAFASCAFKNKVATYVLISAANASSDSFLFYSKMKGQLEEAVKALSFSKLLIFRPPLLERANSSRAMEVVGVKVFRFFNSWGFYYLKNLWLPAF